MNRSEARDMAFKFLYQVEVQKENNEEAINIKALYLSLRIFIKIYFLRGKGWK